MLPPSEDNRENTGPGDGSEKKPHPNYGEYFRFRVITFAQDVYSQVNHYKTSKGKRDYFANAMRRASLFAVRNVFVQLAFAVACVGSVAYWLYMIGRLDPQWIMAIFTVALTATAIVQWWAAHRPWKAMHAQNELMERQTKQTDAMVQQMRLEQRAWLGVHLPRLNPIEVGKQVTGSMVVRNSGRTPGRLDMAATGAMQARPGQSIRGEITAAQNIAKTKVGRESVIPPDGNMEMLVESGTRMSSEVYQGVNDGSLILYVIGYFSYRDVLNQRRTTTCCFEYDRCTHALIAHEKYNHMD